MWRILAVATSTLLFLVDITFVDSIIVRRHWHDGILFDDYAADADSVRYTITGGQGWNDLSTLVDENFLRAKSMFCTRGPGAWLLYPEKDFQFGAKRELKIIYEEHCVPADEINSLQPLGPLYYDSVAASFAFAFTETYFRSEGRMPSAVPKPIKSAIFVGGGKWTLDTGEKKLCILTTLGNDGDVCLVEDLETALGVPGDKVAITADCHDELEDYGLQSCYGPGFHVINYEPDFKLQPIQELCSSEGPGDPANEENRIKHKFLNVMKIWGKRIYNTNENSLGSDQIPNGPERMNVLHKMFEIMGNACPALDPEYLHVLKYAYFLHLRDGAIWNMAEPDAAGTRFDQNSAKWIRAQTFIMDCAKSNDKVATSGCGPQGIDTMKNEVEEDAIEEFLLGDEYDFVIEQIWLMLNFISPYCNNVMMFKDNYWSIFPLLIKKDFLYPLKEQWQNPGVWSHYYPLMFNGFDMENERREMISCVQAIIQKTPFFDPLARPPGFFSGNASTIEAIKPGTGPKPPPAPKPPPPPKPPGGTLPSSKTSVVADVPALDSSAEAEAEQRRKRQKEKTSSEDVAPGKIQQPSKQPSNQPAADIQSSSSAPVTSAKVESITEKTVEPAPTPAPVSTKKPSKKGKKKRNKKGHKKGKRGKKSKKEKKKKAETVVVATDALKEDEKPEK